MTTSSTTDHIDTERKIASLGNKIKIKIGWRIVGRGCGGIPFHGIAGEEVSAALEKGVSRVEKLTKWERAFEGKEFKRVWLERKDGAR